MEDKDAVIAALKGALKQAQPYVLRVSGTSPTQPHGKLRQLEAIKVAKIVEAALNA